MRWETKIMTESHTFTS